MARLKLIVIDVLKPHQPNILELANALAQALGDCQVQIHVEEVDEKTESVTLQVRGPDVSFDVISATVAEYGGSVHSVDEVDVVGDQHQAEAPKADEA